MLLTTSTAAAATIRTFSEEKNDDKNLIFPQVSISPIFYAQLFCTKVSREAFLYLQIRFELFLAQMRS
jgi:hypothetical protein